MSIDVQQLSYIHADKEPLFRQISFSVSQGQKIALIGDNGSGKSTLLEIIKKNIVATSGEVVCSCEPYYVPQHIGQHNDYTIAQALRIDEKCRALHAILAGETTAGHFTTLDDDWEVEEKAIAALADWGLSGLSLNQKLANLSGGEKTRVFLAGINIYNPDIILLDEPTNHLDHQSRKQLYDLIRTSTASMIIISHDRTLLNLLSPIYELDKNGITCYGGNYDFYKTQKEQTLNALYSKLDDKEKELRMARKLAREVAERKQKQDVRGEKNNARKRISRMAMNTLRDKAEKSSSKLKNVHSDKSESISESIREIRTTIPNTKEMKIDFNTSFLHSGKTLVTAQEINYSYPHSCPIWNPPLSFQIKSGERILIKGCNGSGKSTLLKLITGALQSQSGIFTSCDFSHVYLDQEYSMIQNHRSVLEQVEQYNATLYEHEIKIILNRFLFSKESWHKKCVKLSGGEKMKLSLCCLMVSAQTPDMIILDEPTNNIDIQNIEILTSTIREYKGTLLVVSHDEYFIEQIQVRKIIHTD